MALNFLGLKLPTLEQEQRRENYFQNIIFEKLDFQKRHGREPSAEEMQSIDERVQRECGVRVVADKKEKYVRVGFVG